MFNLTFKNAIYDDTTTYNGIPITRIFKLENEMFETEIIRINDEQNMVK